MNVFETIGENVSSGAPLSSINVTGRSVSRSASSTGLAIVADVQMKTGDDP